MQAAFNPPSGIRGSGYGVRGQGVRGQAQINPARRKIQLSLAPLPF